MCLENFNHSHFFFLASIISRRECIGKWERVRKYASKHKYNMFGSTFPTIISRPNDLFPAISRSDKCKLLRHVKSHRAFEKHDTISNEHLAYVWIFLGLQSHYTIEWKRPKWTLIMMIWMPTVRILFLIVINHEGIQEIVIFLFLKLG